MLGALAQAEGEPVQRDADDRRAGRRHEELPEERHTGTSGVADQLGGDRDVAPAEDPEALLGRDLLDPALRLGPLGGVDGQVGHAHGIRAAARQVEAGHRPQEPVGHLGEDAGTVSDERVRAGGASVVQVAQRRERVLDDVVPGVATHRRDERDATGVVLELATVQAGVGRVR